MNKFDLIEYQRQARNHTLPGSLFKLWEDVCKHYDRGLIGTYELEEMKAVIWPNLQALAALRDEINTSFSGQQAA
jgi:hypothetical protein